MMRLLRSNSVLKIIPEAKKPRIKCKCYSKKKGLVVLYNHLYMKAAFHYVL